MPSALRRILSEAIQNKESVLATAWRNGGYLLTQSNPRPAPISTLEFILLASTYLPYTLHTHTYISYGTRLLQA